MLFSPQIISRSNRTAAAGGGGGAEAAAFLARTTGLDATHTNAYTALINGLVADSIWSKFDILRIYATQDSTTALLNLVSSSYTGVTHGSPAFVADRGYTGVNNSSTVYIDTQFVIATNGQAGGGQFGQNSNHISAWSVTDLQSVVDMGAASGSTINANLIIRFTDNNGYFRPVLDPAGGDLTASVTDSRGHFIANRSASNALQAYKNGSSIATASTASNSVPNLPAFDLAQNASGSAGNGSGRQLAMTSYGSSLSGTDATNFYNRLRTYMTAVGVP